jgi:type IV secretion system protein VirB10
MTDDPDIGAEGEPGVVAARRRELARRSRSGGAGRAAGMAAAAIGFAAVAAVVVAPEQVGRFLGFGASRVQEIQRASRVDPGISTEVTRVPEISTEATAAPVIPSPATPAAPTEADRLAALETALRAMMERPQGPALDADGLRTILAEQAQQLRDEQAEALRLQRELHQRELEAARRMAAPVTAGIPSPGQAEERDRLERERARLEAIRNDQINSDALIYDESRPRGGRRAVENRGASGVRELNEQEKFLAASASTEVTTATVTRLDNPSRTIVQGSFLEATLETAINTELPGVIRAVLSVDAWSHDGSAILLPRGTRLIGEYSSRVNVAQRRAQIAWTRAITPSGDSIMLGSIGADELGRSGQTGFVDTRFTERFGSAALISLIGAAPVLIAGGDGGSGGDAGTELATDVSRDLRRATSSALDDYLRIRPTIHIDQGARMIVIVNRDLVF